ncbi:MAG: hypothetical protein Q4A21_02940 [bacterium]|nr:hypothetical protein [bacterium]
MSKKQSNHIKFFAKRDWQIIHLIITILSVLGLVGMVGFVAFFYNNYLESHKLDGDYEQSQRVEIQELKKRIESLENK